MKNLERHQSDLKALLETAKIMSIALAFRSPEFAAKVEDKHKDLKEQVQGRFEKDYQAWYTESCAFLKQILPERLDEFVSLYLSDKKRKDVGMLTYTIQDWLLGNRATINAMTNRKYFDDHSIAGSRFESQREILKSAERRFESSLFNIQQLLRADLFDSELDAATELLKHNFMRGAGAIAGVVLEKHLSSTCDTYKIVIAKKYPTISTFNDALKDGSVIDIPTWRFIQHLGDLRNLCDHGKGSDPTNSQIDELITGVKKITKTVY